MKESPIKYIEIYFGQINCYLINIENQLNYIDENENDKKKIVTNIVSKFSNDHIKHRNDRVKAINELRDIFVKDIEQRNQYKILIDEKIELFQTNLTKVENKLNEIYRFGLTLIEMDLFYIKQFIDEVKLKLKNQENKETTITNPFKDQKTADLFEYIINNWNYDKQQKWANICKAIEGTEIYKIPYRGDYEKYIRTRFSYVGKFQYDKASLNDNNRNNIELLKHIEDFSKK